MPYITVMQSPRFHQITLDEILSGEIQVSDIAPRSVTGTVTHYSEHLNERLARLAQTDELIGVLETFIQKNENVISNIFYIFQKISSLNLRFEVVIFSVNYSIEIIYFLVRI